MSNEQTMTVTGGLTQAPDLAFTPSGAARANFTVASTQRRLNRQTNEWEDGDTLYLPCTAWRDLAQNIADSGLDKGSQVIVQGDLITRQWEDRDGQKRSRIEMQVRAFGVSLARATVAVTKAGSAAQGGQNQGQGGFNGGGGGGWGGQPQNGPQNGAQQGGGWDQPSGW